jgi:CBS domain-containing protein
VVGFSIGEHHDLTALSVLALLAKMLGFVVVTWVLSAKLLPPAILFLRRYVVVDDGMVAGIVSMPKVRSVPGKARTTRTLRDLLRTRVPHACPDELIVDVMDRMTSSSMTVIPVMDRDSGRFLGTLATHDVLDLVALMDEIKEQEKAMGAATETADA